MGWSPGSSTEPLIVIVSPVVKTSPFKTTSRSPSDSCYASCCPYIDTVVAVNETDDMTNKIAINWDVVIIVSRVRYGSQNKIRLYLDYYIKISYVD